MSKLAAKEISYIGLFVAMITVCSWISWSVGGVQGFSFQLLAVYVCVGVLGLKGGMLAVAVYILLGALGVPVFAQFTSGLLTSPTRGYVVGFLPAVAIVGRGEMLCRRIEGKKCPRWQVYCIRIAAMICGTAACYVFGTAWFLVYSGTQGQSYSLWQAIGLCVLPYLWFDLIKILLSAVLTERIGKAFSLKKR